MKVMFKALEYTYDENFIYANYEFDGSTDAGWQVLRDNAMYLNLGKGYELLKTRFCGTCASDIARKHYAFPLPQIIGHEVVAIKIDGGKKCAIEINDTPFYRGDQIQDLYCQSGLITHSPGRMVLGIDRLPGGFGPYILAPKKSIVEIGDLDEFTSVLIEPFAAAVQAVLSSPPEDNDTVAVLGPRRLGSLLVAALAAFRRMSGKKYKIYALARHKELLSLCKRIGADEGIDLSADDGQTLSNRFDIVYDTTGAVEGFEFALRLSKREVHLKSTSGQSVCGLDHMTPFVVDELSLLPFNDESMEFVWENEERENETVYIASKNKNVAITGKKNYHMGAAAAVDTLESTEFQNRLPRFDLAVATSIEEIDKAIRPTQDNESSLVRPRGAILFKGDPEDNPLLNFIARGGKLRSSRCGDFKPALNLLKENRDIADTLSYNVITHLFPVKELGTAFDCAKSSRSIKVIVKHTDYE